MQLAEQVRDAAPQLKLMTNYGGGNFKKQITRADKWGARIALILGESEVAAQQVVVKTCAVVNKKRWRKAKSLRVWL